MMKVFWVEVFQRIAKGLMDCHLTCPFWNLQVDDNPDSLQVRKIYSWRCFRLDRGHLSRPFSSWHNGLEYLAKVLPSIDDESIFSEDVSENCQVWWIDARWWIDANWPASSETPNLTITAIVVQERRIWRCFRLDGRASKPPLPLMTTAIVWTKLACLNLQAASGLRRSRPNQIVIIGGEVLWWKCGLRWRGGSRFFWRSKHWIQNFRAALIKGSANANCSFWEMSSWSSWKHNVPPWWW